MVADVTDYTGMKVGVWKARYTPEGRRVTKIIEEAASKERERFLKGALYGLDPANYGTVVRVRSDV